LKNLPIIPALLHASILGLLTAAIPLKAIAVATLLAISRDDGGKVDIIVDPSAVEADQAKSVHVLGFSSQDELLMVESEGSFSPQEWKQLLERGQSICCQHQQTGLDTAMADGELEPSSIKDFIRSVMETKVARDLYWK
jgi:exosome complex component RRP46